MRKFLFLICLIILGCKNQKEASIDYGNLDSVTIYETGCEGTCPIYTMTIYANGTATFFGEAHTNTLGTQTYAFSKDAVAQLFKDLKSLDFGTFKEEQSYIVDIPETKLEYHDNTIIVKDFTKIPTPFSAVLKSLKELTRSTNFVN